MIAVVTGATAGFGELLARRWVEEGHRVVGVGRRQDRLRALQADLGERFLPLALDIRDRVEVERAFTQLPKAFQDVDVLVNNAGLALGLEPAQKASLDDWDTVVETNVNGLLYCTRALLPGMVARDRGHIVNLGSVAGEFPYPGGNVYGATKAFVHQFSLNLRADLQGTQVRVTNIEPGLVGGTEFSTVRFNGDSARANAVYEGAEPLRTEDVVDVVCWVTSRPPRVNINVVSLMPVGQSFGPLPVQRRPKAAG
jgi:3-hydroxy acid dehydrogenase/malonic semialdehyde reductase